MHAYSSLLITKAKYNTLNSIMFLKLAETRIIKPKVLEAAEVILSLCSQKLKFESNSTPRSFILSTEFSTTPSMLYKDEK